MKDKELSLEDFVKKLHSRAYDVNLHGKMLYGDEESYKAQEQIKALMDDGLRWRGTSMRPVFYETNKGRLYWTYRAGTIEE